jgi:Zinc dependent phospholipase C
MPTPFMHLQLSESLRSQIVDAGGGAAAVLPSSSYWPDFYLGSVAPDYQTICGIPRKKTHFYGMPPEERCEGPRMLIARYPQLSPGSELDPKPAAFLSGYLVHVFLDLKWHFDVVLPFFVDNALYENPHEAYLAHLILLAYLDRLALQSLPDSARSDLASSTPDYKLPFAEDEDLRLWRDFLKAQLEPGATTKTVEIFSERLQMTSHEFAAKLNDQDWMDRELFSKVPVSDASRILADSTVECLDLISSYWDGRL